MTTRCLTVYDLPALDRVVIARSPQIRPWLDLVIGSYKSGALRYNGFACPLPANSPSSNSVVTSW